MNKKSFLILLAAVSVILISTVSLTSSPPFKRSESNVTLLSVTETPTKHQTKVVVSASDHDFFIEYIAKNEKDYQPYNLLEEALEENNIPLEVETYDFGVFVKSINNLESTNEKAWIYFVNGKSGQVAADKMELSKGDLVEWKYIAPSE